MGQELLDLGGYRVVAIRAAVVATIVLVPAFVIVVRVVFVIAVIRIRAVRGSRITISRRTVIRVTVRIRIVRRGGVVGIIGIGVKSVVPESVIPRGQKRKTETAEEDERIASMMPVPPVPTVIAIVSAESICPIPIVSEATSIGIKP